MNTKTALVIIVAIGTVGVGYALWKHYQNFPPNSLNYSSGGGLSGNLNLNPIVSGIGTGIGNAIGGLGTALGNAFNSHANDYGDNYDY